MVPLIGIEAPRASFYLEESTNRTGCGARRAHTKWAVAPPSCNQSNVILDTLVGLPILVTNWDKAYLSGEAFHATPDKANAKKCQHKI